MKKNNSKLKAAAAVVLAALLLIAVNLCVSKLSEKLGLRLDMTGNKLYELSDETLNVLGELDMPTILPSTTRKSNCPSSARTITYMSEKDRPTAKSVIIAKNFPNAMESMLTGALIRS